jgi:hypothetical protein
MPKKNTGVSDKSDNELKDSNSYDIELKNQLEKDPLATLENGMVVEGKLALIEIQEYDATHFLDFKNIIDFKVVEGAIK